ncbi:hypothetical protein JTB14_013106 [Gonioctena quinquepunctata]|nr:hypothetical protein JTB14_013106 [Gonioctena quinquepunctata]
MLTETTLCSKNMQQESHPEKSENNIINELNERQSRAVNVMLYYLPESVPNENDIELQGYDKRNINDNLRIVRTFRVRRRTKMGSEFRGGFLNAIEALKVLKNSKNM